MSENPITRMIDRLAQRLLLTVARATIKRVRGNAKIQLLQLQLLSGEVRDQVEQFQGYGFSSVPFEDAEAAVMFVGGRREHGLVVGVDDRRYRLTTLAEGEVALYDDQGVAIHLKRNNVVELLRGTTKVVVDGDNDTLTLEADASNKIVISPSGIDFTGAAYTFN